MSSYKPYPAYKDSEIDWFPKMPTEWESIRVKHIFGERVEKGFPDEPLLAATQTKGVVRKEDYENTTVTAQKDFHLLKLVRVGDFVISLRSFQGGIEIAHQKGIISPAYTIMVPDDDIDKEYFKHLFKSKYFVDGLTTFVTGIREGQNIDYSKFRRSFLPLPPKPEQTAIAQFLDRKTAEIKAFIELKEKTIALLKERKTAIINQAVTKGLDPKVEMKDSGIEWLGEIPKHWKVKPVGSFFLERKEKNKRMKESLVLSLSHGNVKRRVMDNKGLLPESFSTYQITHPGDIVFRLTDLQNDKKSLRNGQTKETGIITSAYLCIYTNRSISAEYINFLFRIYDLKKVFYAFGAGIRQGAGYSEIRKLKVVVPPDDEQKKIVEEIEKILNELDSSINKAENEIALIKEYQQSLISEVVTGKIDVRIIQ